MSDTSSEAANTMPQDERIRQRAYEIWESEGRGGNPEDHWVRAEQDLADTRQESVDTVEETASPRAGTGAASTSTGETSD
jgi:hypothetical protein